MIVDLRGSGLSQIPFKIEKEVNFQIYLVLQKSLISLKMKREHIYLVLKNTKSNWNWYRW
jgi:hypothetical protein